MLTSPPLSVTTAPGLTMASEVLLSTRFSASEPATPTLPAPLAPDMATAPKLLVPSAASSGPALASWVCVVPLLLVVMRLQRQTLGRDLVVLADVGGVGGVDDVDGDADADLDLVAATAAAGGRGIDRAAVALGVGVGVVAGGLA